MSIYLRRFTFFFFVGSLVIVSLLQPTVAQAALAFPIGEPATAYGRIDAMDASIEPSVTDGYRAGISQWKKLKASSKKPCSSEVDSFELLHAAKTETVVLLLHGYGLNPGKMAFLAEFFAKNGSNVIVPRLSGHFDENLRDLDHVKREDWLVLARKSLKVAHALGKRTIVVGYSLGGLLASRLDLETPEKIHALILLAPAWRVSSMASVGAGLGGLFGMSLNDLRKIPLECKPEARYIPAAGGNEIEHLAEETEMLYGGTYPSMDVSIFRRLKSPHYVAVVDDDIAVDTRSILSIFPSLDNTDWFSALGRFPSGGHLLFDHDYSLMTNPVESTYPGNLGTQMLEFLKHAL